MKSFLIRNIRSNISYVEKFQRNFSIYIYILYIVKQYTNIYTLGSKLDNPKFFIGKIQAKLDGGLRPPPGGKATGPPGGNKQ